MRFIVIASILILASCATTATSQKTQNPIQPSEKEEGIEYSLIGAGAIMLPLDFFLQTIIHEGSHALAGIFIGEEVGKFLPYPNVYGGKFTFGAMELATTPKELERLDYAFLNIAPKLTDAIMLSSYMILEEQNLLPENQFAQLAIWVVAFGAWIDLAKDICSGICYESPKNDLVLFEQNAEFSEEGAILFRIGILLTAGLSAYPLYRGMEKIIDPEDEAIETYGSVVIGPGTISYTINF